jgi:hypothetical protein
MTGMTRTSRRQFTKSLAAAGAVAPLAATNLFGQTAPAPPPTGRDVPAQAPPAPEEKTPSALGKALSEVVRAQHGQFLTAEDLATIDSGFQDLAPYVERFREYPLVNGDEPDFSFIALARRW